MMLFGGNNIFIQFWINEGQIHDGVAKKALFQMNELSNLIKPYKAVIIGSSEFFCSPEINLKFYRKVSLCKSYLYVKNINIIKCFIFSKIITENMSNLSKNDIIYFRYPLFITSIPIISFSKKNRCRIIFEHNTIELDEFKLRNGKFSFSYLHEYIFGYIIRNFSDAIVGVTEEITHYQLSNSKNKNKPNITIGNGIKVNSCNIRQITAIKNEIINLLCVANFNRWHGIDRLIQGISNYNGDFKIILHLVGDGKEKPKLGESVNELKISDKVIFHGFKSGEELDALFNQCHIAIGSLGIHRIGLSEASTLKTREYCARGIPYIIACGDPDFPDEFPYIFRVPPDESPIDIESVIQFTQKVFSDPEHPQKMREYAEEHLDWSVKMKKLKEFLETI